MKFKDYVENLTKQLKENPEWAKLDAVYATGEEGYSYEYVTHNAAPGYLHNGEMDTTGDEDFNTVCIN